MGSHEEPQIIFYFGGKPITDRITEAEIVATPEAERKILLPMLGSWETREIRFKPGKHWHCRSRKRFIKLLMGERMSRKAAEVWAKSIQIAVQKRFNAGTSYQEVWSRYLINKTFFKGKEEENGKDPD